MATTLQEFYRGEVVLVTGATGFLGKALLAKLLLSCPDIEKIIVLLRKKKECTVSERLSATLSGSVSDESLDNLTLMISNIKKPWRPIGL
jgi:fatty acyl-CoA reductase